jgi:branched-chain amino acid transport system permease protein
VIDDLGLHPTDRAILERRIRALVTPELVAEHAARPFGPHSPALEEVLHFLRRNPAPGVPRFVVHRRGHASWVVGLKPERPGGRMPVVGAAEHPAREGAEHEVFRRRLDFYGLLP